MTDTSEYKEMKCWDCQKITKEHSSSIKSWRVYRCKDCEESLGMHVWNSMEADILKVVENNIIERIIRREEEAKRREEEAKRANIPYDSQRENKDNEIDEKDKTYALYEEH